MEKLAEMFHTSPATLTALNSPDTKLAPGTVITVPGVVAANKNYDAKLPDHWRATLSTLNVDASQPQAAKVRRVPRRTRCCAPMTPAAS